MPKGLIPSRFTHLLEGTTLGHLATINENGNPQVNPVWYLWDEGRLLLGVRADTAKYHNLRRNPNLAMSILDPENPFHYLELRGKVIEFALYLDLSFVNHLSQKYTGSDFDPSTSGQERYKLAVEIESWTGQ